MILTYQRDTHTNQNLQGMYFYAFYKWKHHIFRLILRYFFKWAETIWYMTESCSTKLPALLCELSLTFHNIEWRQPHYNQWTQDVFSEDTIAIFINIRVRENISFKLFSIWITLSAQDNIFADSSYSFIATSELLLLYLLLTLNIESMFPLQ